MMQGDLGSLGLSRGNMADGKCMVKVLEGNLCTDSGLPLIGSVSPGEGDLSGAWRLHPGVAYKILDHLVKLRVIFFQKPAVPLFIPPIRVGPVGFTGSSAFFPPFCILHQILRFWLQALNHNENILKFANS